jgi:hypothetical protein
MHRKQQRTKSRPWLKRRGLRWSMIGLGVLALIGVVVLGALAATVGGKGTQRAVLRMARLAAIPSSATDLHCEGTGGSTGGVYYLRFTAPAEDINRFVMNSSELRGRAPQALGPEHMYLPEAQPGPDATQPAQHTYYAADPRFPWFDPAVRTKGRLYVIPPDRDSNSAVVVIDDEKQTVYVRVKHK